MTHTRNQVRFKDAELQTVSSRYFGVVEEAEAFIDTLRASPVPPTWITIGEQVRSDWRIRRVG
jgi:hypothetical protein